MMIFKNREERVDYCIGTLARLLDWSYERTAAVFATFDENEQKRLLDTFAFEGSIMGDK